MESARYQAEISKEIQEIFNQILFSSEEDEHGIFWKLDDYHKEDIYSGIAGILIFLCEYYNLTGNKEASKLISKSAGWLMEYCKKTDPSNNTFFTGRTGVMYVILMAYKCIGETKQEKKVSELLKVTCERIESGNNKHDLLNGTAGTILGLLLLHVETNEKKIMEKINQLTTGLVESKKWDGIGLFWDKNEDNRGLCGLAHGSSGIGFVFLMLGKYLKNTSYYDIAKYAFEYEDQFYVNELFNWPDFRISSRTDLGKKINEQSRFANSWCHGAPGIGFARLTAYKILRENKYKINVHSAAKNILIYNKSNRIMPDCLCHGYLGNSMLFLELYRATHFEQFLWEYRKICFEAIIRKKRKGRYGYGRPNSGNFELSFFLGLSGIGYSFIQALKPAPSFNYLIPSV